MIAYLFPDPLIRLRRGLERMARPETWMEPLLERGVTIVWEHNRAGLLMGRDIDGQPFKPVKRKHGGPPLLREAYRAINLAVVDAGQTGRNTFELRLSWPGFKREGRDILSMHMRPYHNRPARRAIGIRQTAIDEFMAEGRRFLGREFRELTNTAHVASSGVGGTGSAVLRGRR